MKTRAKMWASLEERIKSTVSSKQLEQLLYSDGLTIREVYDYVDFVVAPGFYFKGKQELIDICEEWCDTVRLKRILEEVIKDIFVGGSGNAWVELGYTEDGRDIASLRILNPNYMDYIRDSSNNVKLDEYGDPVGYVKKRTGTHGAEIMWTRDKIIVAGEEVWKRQRADEDGRDRIAHFKLFSIGGSYLGMTPLASCYKQALIRLNLEDNVGESGFRAGGVIGYVDVEGIGEVPTKKLKELARDLQNVTTRTIFVFPSYVKIERFPTPDLRDRTDLIMYFASVQSLGMGFPVTRHFIPLSRVTARASESMEVDFEQRIMAMQDRLAEQVREKLLFRLLKARGMVKTLKEVPKIVFRTRVPHILENKINLISRLGRRDLIRRDPELEKQLRQELGLPTKYLDRELKKWEADSNLVPSSPKSKSDVDIDTIAEEVSERVSEELS